MTQDARVELTFQGTEALTMLNALKQYETHWSTLVLSTDHSKGTEVSQAMVVAWREARKLRIRLEEEIEMHQLDPVLAGPASMAVY